MCVLGAGGVGVPKQGLRQVLLPAVPADLGVVLGVGGGLNQRRELIFRLFNGTWERQCTDGPRDCV